MASGSKPWIAIVYFYLISAICVITMIFAGINGLMGLFSYVDPESNLEGWTWQKYADIEEYKRGEPSVVRKPGNPEHPADTAIISVITDEEWEKKWQNFRQQTLQGQRLQGKRSFANMVIVLIVCLPCFWFHWRPARRATLTGVGNGDKSVDRRAAG